MSEYISKLLERITAALGELQAYSESIGETGLQETIAHMLAEVEELRKRGGRQA